MAVAAVSDLTQWLVGYGKGDSAALDRLLPHVYSELKKLAAAQLKRESAGHTLQPTALVHEAYLRLIDQREVQWQNRAHFFGVAAQIMRRILIDHARRKRARKRDAGGVRVTFDERLPSTSDGEPDLLALDDALNRLHELDPRQARVVELRYFGGLSVEETAEALSTSPATVKRDWAVARAWLHRELEREDGD